MMLIEWEENKNNNFIGGYIDEKVCDNLIEYLKNVNIKCQLK